MKVKYVCCECGGDRVSFSSPVSLSWDIEKQEFVAIPHSDITDDFCADCGEEVKTKEVDI